MPRSSRAAGGSRPSSAPRTSRFGDGEVRRSAIASSRAGDVITIDGGTGEVFEGAVAGATEVVPEARTLLAWAAELGIPIGGR